ncbi:MAG: thiamine-phosphate kinase [Gammaproteobacteria bacterium]|nr:thiamine-phosphate kinase [Gammaproteobacteria bacterium]
MPIIHTGHARPIGVLKGRAVVTTDALVAGVHFFESTDPYRLGHKAVAVNLSDLAAMGAVPVELSMLVDLTHQDNAWSEQLLAGAAVLAKAHSSRLVHSIARAQRLRLSVQALGDLRDGNALTRSGAAIGDQIMVTGTLGDAAGALRLMQTGVFDRSQPTHASLAARLEMPIPRVAAGLLLAGRASAGLDLSDGLLGDAAHLLGPMAPGIHLHAEQLPLSSALLDVFGRQRGEELALTGGDDYELCITAPPQHTDRLMAELHHQGTPATIVGEVTKSHGIKLLSGSEELPIVGGYQHFGSDA